jgi:hypothetical protein
MFVFLTAIRHPANANDMAQVERLLSITLQSICGQTDGNFKVVVVCNVKPNLVFEDNRVHYHLVDFPAPSLQKSSSLEPAPKFKDKGTKYMSGMLYARKFNPDYLYIIDSDDWVNKNLVKTLSSNPKYPVWYVDKGCMVNFSKKEFKRIRGLSRYCGSTFLYDFKYLIEYADVKNDIDEFSNQDALIEGTSEFFILRLMCNHTINYRHFKSIGVTPKAVPLSTACWVQGTGENVSGSMGGSRGLPLDEKFINTYSLPDSLLSNEQATLMLSLRGRVTECISYFKWMLSKWTGVNRF